MSEIVAIDDAPLKRRKAGRPPRDPAEWEAAFLDYYRAKGNLHNAARAAGVSVNTVAKRRRLHPPFNAAVRLAYREYGALLKEKLGELGIEKGNVIALIASLKGHSTRMAKRFSEKAVDQRVMNITVNQVSAPPDALETLARLEASMNADDVRTMRGEIIDVSPLALASGGDRPPNDRDEETR